MINNPLKKLESLGQSIWMDFIRREMIDSGELQRYIDEDGVSGITSNPSIFDKAIVGSHDYDAEIRTLASEGRSAEEIYQALTVEDIQRAADLFQPLYKKLDGKDGFVSLEVSPHLAHDTNGTIREARRLWEAVDRPNLMIKVPATIEGLPAIQQLISDGINVNITLLFGLPRYHQVIEAYIGGLEARAAAGKPIKHIASVASFFLSRIDVLIDPMVEKIRFTGKPDAQAIAGVEGEVAIASAKIAYQIYQEAFASNRFRKLAGLGARTQRLLWASTSTKNPEYSDTKYVEALIGRETINTVTLETLNAYRDHGHPALQLEEGVGNAYHLMDRLPQAGIDLDAITQQLEDEGVEKFEKAYDDVMTSLQQKLAAV